MKIRQSLLLAPAVLLLLGGCTDTVVVREPRPRPAVVVAGGPPPPPALIVETPGPRPYDRAIFHRGHWRWNGRRYVWVRGYYARV